MIISFAGHSLVKGADRVKERVKEEIRKNLDENRVVCYLGGYGDFDEICARACRELKKTNANIELVYVAPYINISEQEKIKEMEREGFCDSSIYPPIENVPLKFAILKRNEWMMTSADMIIAYVNHSWGGAYKSLRIARRKKKRIVNICESL